MGSREEAAVLKNSQWLEPHFLAGAQENRLLTFTEKLSRPGILEVHLIVVTVCS